MHLFNLFGQFVKETFAICTAYMQGKYMVYEKKIVMKLQQMHRGKSADSPRIPCT